MSSEITLKGNFYIYDLWLLKKPAKILNLFT